MRQVSILLTCFCIASAVDICLPATHSVLVTSISDRKDHVDHHDREYAEADHMHLWIDGTAMKSLVHIFDTHDSFHRREPDGFVIRDYAKKLQWRGRWDPQKKTVYDCEEMLLAETMSPFCWKGLNSTGSGSIGEHAKVDFYGGHWEDHSRSEFAEKELEILVEAGTKGIPMEERARGFERQPGGDVAWMEHRQFWNLSEDKIDPKVFTIPKECPPAPAGKLHSRYGDANGGVAFSRTVNTINKAKGTVTFNQGCTSTDPYGSDNCNFAWGATEKINYDVELDEDITSGSLTVSAKVNKVIPFEFTCAICGVNCTITIPIVKQKVSFPMPACPITHMSLKNITSVTLPGKNPLGIGAGVEGSAAVVDQTGTTVLKLSFTAKITD